MFFDFYYHNKLYFMGACFKVKQSKAKESLYRNQSLDSKFKHQKYTISPNKRLSSTFDGSNISPERSSIQVSIEKQAQLPDLSPEKDDEDDFERHRSSSLSCIIKRSTKSLNKADKKDSLTKNNSHDETKMSNLQGSSNSKDQDLNVSRTLKMYLPNQVEDFQFLLPISFAGPLVIPYVDYQQYMQT